MECTAILPRIGVRTIGVIVSNLCNIRPSVRVTAQGCLTKTSALWPLASEHITRRLFHSRFLQHPPPTLRHHLESFDAVYILLNFICTILLNSGLQKVVSEHVCASKDKYLWSLPYCTPHCSTRIACVCYLEFCLNTECEYVTSSSVSVFGPLW